MSDGSAAGPGGPAAFILERFVEEPKWTDVVVAYSSVVAAVAGILSAVGVWFAFKQFQLAKRIAQLQFEDALNKEYRSFITKIPIGAFLNEPLTAEQEQKCFDDMVRYFDLCNEQAFLADRGRVSRVVWESWEQGICANFQKKAFAAAWHKLMARDSTQFQDLQRVIRHLPEIRLQRMLPE